MKVLISLRGEHTVGGEHAVLLLITDKGVFSEIGEYLGLITGTARSDKGDLTGSGIEKFLCLFDYGMSVTALKRTILKERKFIGKSLLPGNGFSFT